MIFFAAFYMKALQDVSFKLIFGTIRDRMMYVDV